MRAPFVVTERYEVAPGFGPTFHRWGTEMLEEMAWSDSFLGGRVLESGRTGEGRLLHRWADPAVARLWERSQTRARWLADAAPFARPVPVLERRPVTLPETPVRPTPPSPPPGPPPGPPPVPPKWKTAVVTLTAVFPPVLFFNLTLIPRLAQVNVVLRTLVLCVGVTALVTWVMMPRLMPLFRPWLQRPRRARAGRALRARATRFTPQTGELTARPIAAIGSRPSAELLIPAYPPTAQEVRHHDPRPSRGHARYLQQAPPDRRDRR